MTIGICNLADCVNAAISSASTPIGILQLSSVVRDFNAGFVKSVATDANLPSAALNTGRMIFVCSTCSYRVSNGIAWTDDFSTVYSGSVFAWGCNYRGALGDNSTFNKSSPVSVVGGLTDWCEISAGGVHTLAIRTNGTAWAWGCNGQGRLGDNTVVNKSSPVSVVGGFTDWKQLSTGSNHSLGLRTNGTTWSWGYNAQGGLGDNTTVSRSSPVSVVGGFSDWCHVSTGSNFSLGIRTGGSAWAWGYNFRGNLGNNSTASSSSPVSVVGGFTDWCQLSGGQQHTLGLRTNGTIWAWGGGAVGQIGNNTASNRSSPVSIVGGISNWSSLSSKVNQSFGVQSTGTAWAWGQNTGGVLGDNTVSTRISPVSIVGGFTDWCKIGAGFYHTLGGRTNGTVWAWGNNCCGPFGNNTTTSASSPVSSLLSADNWTSLSAGCRFSLVARTRGF